MHIKKVTNNKVYNFTQPDKIPTKSKGLFARLLSIFAYSGKLSKQLINKSLPEHPYRVLSIEKDEEENFTVLVQIANTKHIFRMKPEEILVNDEMLTYFHQKDVRALTYLGYLGINSPRYKILAKRLSENDNKLIFALKERGKKEALIKTADEISADDRLITGLHQKDAHMIGYAVATEHTICEEKQKAELLKQVANNNNS